MREREPPLADTSGMAAVDNIAAVSARYLSPKSGRNLKALSEARADQLSDSPAVEWHALKNVGQTTLRYLVIEKKYPAKP